MTIEQALQKIADLEAENARLRARIVELEDPEAPMTDGLHWKSEAGLTFTQDKDSREQYERKRKLLKGGE